MHLAKGIWHFFNVRDSDKHGQKKRRKKPPAFSFALDAIKKWSVDLVKYRATSQLNKVISSAMHTERKQLKSRNVLVKIKLMDNTLIYIWGIQIAMKHWIYCSWWAMLGTEMHRNSFRGANYTRTEHRGI